MRYIVVDLEGASRVSFGRLSEMRDWAREVSAHDADILGELLIERYDARGQKVGESQWADEFLGNIWESMAVPGSIAFATAGGVFPFMAEADRPQTALISAAFAQELRPSPSDPWSGRAESMYFESYRLHEGAIGTRVQPQGETVASSPRSLLAMVS
ncbi:MAG TPA: hypothetical protein VG147_16775 [Solirubrobacteraceae bacterium]|jgi:hypothetical protein|nr:hypothetical protein [Solirubrobacteraceae bacterium]